MYNNESPKVLQLAEFLITKFQYQAVAVQNRDNELWLVNGMANDYQIIRVSCKSIESVDLELNQINQILEVVKNSLHIKGSFLDIHVGKEEILPEEHFFSCSIDTDYYSGIDLDTTFPGIRNVIHEVKNSVGEAKSILNNINEFRKKTIQDKVKKFKPNGTLAIIAICAVIYILGFFITHMLRNNGYQGLQVDVAIILGAYYQAFIVGAHEFLRFITAGFVHIDFFHFFFNMIAMYNLGSFFEKFYGTKHMLIILLASIVGGNIFVFLCTQNNVSLGLSGGLYGLMASMVVQLFYTGMIKQKYIRNQIINLILINVIITFMPGVSMFGHIGGFLTGLLMSIILIKDDKLKVFIRNAKISLVIAFVILGGLVVSKKEFYPEYRRTDEEVFEVLRDINLDSYADHLERKMAEYYSSH